MDTNLNNLRVIDKHEDDLRGKSLKSLKQLSCSSPAKRHLGGSMQDIESVVFVPVVFVSTSADEMVSVPPLLRECSMVEQCADLYKYT